MPYHILVIGESCVDVFQYGLCKRICPEAPCPVFKPTYKTESYGMAANVVANLKSLDSTLKIDFITNLSKPYKIRFIEEKSNQMLLRQDINDHIGEFLKIDSSILWKYDCVVVSDYDKGFITENDLSLISANSKLTFLDTKKILDYYAAYYSFIKINKQEYNYSVKYNRTILDWAKQIIVTNGEEGCEYMGKTYSTEKVQLMDVSGAGDTFLAGLVYNYLETENIETAITFANICASSVVKKRGVSVYEKEG